MAAQIIVETGITSGTKHWIDKPVIRIGSDADGDLCLPSSELPDRAITLEFHQGVYRVYNRCDSDIRVGQQRVSANGCLPLDNGEMLELPDGTKLRLEFDGDPSPAACPVDELNDELVDAVDIAGGDPQESKAAQKKSNMVQVAIILFCCVVCGLVLTTESSTTSTKSATPTFQNAIETLADGDPLKLRIQYAESLVVRRKTEIARSVFAEIRQQLLADDQSTNESDVQHPALSYVEYRLR